MAGAPTELLQRVPLFSDLENRELEQIAGSMKQRRFAAGETVAEEGEPGVGFFVIEDGTARVTVGGEERRRLRSGDYFGEVALISGADRTATVTAESDLTCWGLTAWSFRPIVEENASIAWKLLQAMAKML
jgi:CRP/FNR family cyclic AMP-dependent transcriptional regulator